MYSLQGCNIRRHWSQSLYILFYPILFMLFYQLNFLSICFCRYKFVIELWVIGFLLCQKLFITIFSSFLNNLFYWFQILMLMLLKRLRIHTNWKFLIFSHFKLTDCLLFEQFLIVQFLFFYIQRSFVFQQFFTYVLLFH